MSALPSSATLDEHLNEQLINCLNLQTNVIRNLTQYSQHISLQLFEIKANVDMLTSRVMSLEHEQLESYFLPPVPIHIPLTPSLVDPLFFLQPTFEMPLPSNKSLFSNVSDYTVKSAPFTFATTTQEQRPSNISFILNQFRSSALTSINDDDDNADDSEERTPLFQPIKSTFVDVKNGEDDEIILFCERAKLYRFDATTNQTKDRAVGEMKILQHKTSHLCRIVMRHEQVLKVYANHQITSQMELRPYQEKENTYVWSAIDYADGVPKHENLCVKFKTKDKARIFARIFNQAKEINRHQLDDLSAIGRMSLADDDIIVIGEIKPTREKIELAKMLQLPSTFYLYENKEPCRGCRGCREDSSPISLDEVQYGNRMNSYDATAALFENFPTGFFPNVSLPSLMSMMPTWLSDGPDSSSPLTMHSPPKDYRIKIKAKRSLPNNRPPPPPSLYPDFEQPSTITDGSDERAAIQTHQKKSRNFSDQVKRELSEQTQIVTIKDDKTSTSHFDTNRPSTFTNSTTSVFGNLTPINTSDFSLTNLNKTTPKTEFQFSTPTSSTTKNTSSLFKFADAAKLGFADLVKQTSNTQFNINDTEKRVFPGQGALIFDESSTDPTATENNEDYEPTTSFQIVQLSPVEVKTGEEDEAIIFCERAKLYRFDAPTNQMKERGIGEMKILQHKTSHLCRVLMRREQVLKVCANHQITSQMELKPHREKDNAYIWSAMDYADGVGKHETLCVKFKTTDQAKQFFQQFNNAKSTNSNIQQ